MKTTANANPSVETQALVLALLAFIAGIVHQTYTDYGMLLLLGIGMVFPGIPHGAVDNHLMVSQDASVKGRVRFYLSYLGIMAGVLLLWLLIPDGALLLFLFLSALHFGETDNRRYGILGLGFGLWHGLLLLVFLLAGHYPETRIYLDLLAVSAPDWEQGEAFALAGIAGLMLTASLLYSARHSRRHLGLYLLFLATSWFLPLLTAFGLYFVFIHSVTAWNDIRLGLGRPHGALFRMALPYTLVALVMLALFLLIKDASWRLQPSVAWFFIFLSCISAPHILLMHLFYADQDG